MGTDFASMLDHNHYLEQGDRQESNKYLVVENYIKQVIQSGIYQKDEQNYRLFVH